MTTVLAPHRGVLRAVRGCALAVTSALLASTAHVASGAPAPDAALTVLLTLAVAAAGTALADRRRGPVALLAAVGTVRLAVTLPAEHLIRSVRTKLIPGWTAALTKDGETVRTITWTADPGVGIGPGEYQEFEVSAGPLPEDADQLVLPTVQTYDSGEVVAWDPPPAECAEPAHPAPVLELAPEEEDTAVAPAAAASPQDTTARWLGGTALAVGALGLGMAAGTVLRSRRRTAS